MLEQTKLESDVKKEPMTNSPAPAINKQQAQVVSARGSLTVPSERVDLSQQPVQPISTVNPYQGKLTIKAKVIHKSDMREWKNARSSGKLFSVDLADNSGEIHATAFNADADMLFSVLQEGHVYYISNAKVKPASRYNTMKNDHELTLYDQTIVQEADIKAQDIAIKYNFVPLAEIAALADKSVCGIIRHISHHMHWPFHILFLYTSPSQQVTLFKMNAFFFKYRPSIIQIESLIRYQQIN